MEMSRVQKIKEHDTAEARKKYFRYEGAAVIRKQMAVSFYAKINF